VGERVLVGKVVGKGGMGDTESTFLLFSFCSWGCCVADFLGRVT